MKNYLVGGAVRDRLLGYPSDERDWVVVGATPQEMIDKGFTPVGKDFPVFLHPQTKEEYALARTERKSGHGYQGFVVDAAPSVTLQEDLRRRDLTINAIAESANGEIVDPYGGRRDLDNKILRHVSTSFREDPVRILRVARFLARYRHLGFCIAEETSALMRQMVTAGEADYLVPERVWKEFSRALSERSPMAFLETLDKCGALAVLMPEIAALMRNDSRATTGAIMDAASKHSQDSRIRFACLVSDLDTIDALTADLDIAAIAKRSTPSCSALCQRLKVPNDYRDLAVIVIRFFSTYGNATALPAETIVDMLYCIDALRKPQRFKDFLQCCDVRVIGKMGNKTPHNKSIVASREFLQQCLEATLQVKPDKLLAQGYRGAELGNALKKEQAKAVSHILASITDAGK